MAHEERQLVHAAIASARFKSTAKKRKARGGPVGACVGNSVTDLNWQRSTVFWDTLARGPWQWMNAVSGARYVLKDFGVSGDKTKDILNRMADVLAIDPDFVLIDSLFINDLNTGATGESWELYSLPNATAILNLCGDRPIYITTETRLDAYSTALKRAAFTKANKWIRDLPLTRDNVFVLDGARSWENPDTQSSATQMADQLLAIDGIHQSDYGGQQRGLALASGFVHLIPEMNLAGFEDWTFLTENPRGWGDNATGVNNFLLAAPTDTSGTGPESWLLNRSAAGTTAAMSKVAHPLENYRKGEIVQVVASFNANHDTVTFGPRAIGIGATVTDGGSASRNNAYAPAIRNGRYYQCIVAGTCANPVRTDLWSTTLGDIVVSGTAQFRVIESFYPGEIVEVVADILIPESTGNLHAWVSATILGTQGNRSCNCLLASNPNANSRFAYTPPRLTLRNPDLVIQEGANNVSVNVAVRGDAAGSATVQCPLIGFRKQR